MKHLSKILSVLLCLAMVAGVFAMTVSAAETVDHVVISQVYGGGGNSNAPYKNDFIELYNPTSSAVSLSGWSVQHASKTGSFTQNIVKFESDDVIAAGGYFLIMLKSGGDNGADLPTPDATKTTIDIGGKDFKVALVKNQEFITGVSDADVVDFIGVNSNEAEGTKMSQMPSGNQVAAIRKNGGTTDTNNNSSDFEQGAPNPRNSQSGKADPATGVTPSKTTLTLALGASEKLTATVAPETAEQGVEWSADNSGVVSIYNGTITGIKAGTATVTVAAASNPEIKATVTVTVTDHTFSSSDTVKNALDANKDTLVYVVGEVVYIDGNNFYIQDATGAINAYVPAGLSGVKVGDTLKAAGTRGEYKTLPQVKVGVVTVTAGTPSITPVAVDSIADLADHKCALVKLTNLTIQKIDDNNGTYKNANITFEDANGDTIELYKAIWDKVDGEWPLKAGDKVASVTAVVSAYSGLQLRNLNSSDISTDWPVTGVTLPETSTVITGETITLTPVIAPENAANKNVTWASDNTSVATVDASGKVTGAKAGTATITVTTADGSFTASCVITVSDKKVPATSVTLNKTEATVVVGNTLDLTATITPEDSTDNITWSSSDETIATVVNGKVTALKNGTVIITATANDSVKATCTITVNLPPVSGVTLDKTTASVVVGKDITLTATVAPENAGNKNVTWTSSDATIATVDANGKVTGVKEGKVTITVTTVDGTKTATCEVAVSKAASATSATYIEGVNKDGKIYFDGTITNGRINGVTDINKAVGITLEAAGADGEYYISFVVDGAKKYLSINPEASGKTAAFAIVDAKEDNGIWLVDKSAKTIISKALGTRGIGTQIGSKYSNFSTYAISNMEKVDEYHFAVYKNDSPSATGDLSNPLVAVLALVSVLGLGVVVLNRKKFSF